MKSAYLIFPILLVIGCDLGTPPPVPSSDVRIRIADFPNISLKLTDYDQVAITHLLGTNLCSSNLIAVSVGTKDSSGYSEFTRSTSVFDSESELYRVLFSFNVKMDSSLIVAPLTIRYLLSDSSSIDVDTTIALYTYPYPSVRILVDSSTNVYGHFQDFDRIGNKFYIHPTGPEGLYEYDLVTKQLRHLFSYGGGDHIAADSIFVFCEEGEILYRFNIVSDTVDLFAIVLPVNPSGLEAYNGSLYVLADYPPISIRRYSYDGVFLDSVAFSEDVYYLTIYDSIAYMTVWTRPNRLKRYDLRTNTFLTDVPGPAYNLYGIKIHQGVMYYSDLNKFFIGYLPIESLGN